MRKALLDFSKTHLVVILAFIGISMAYFNPLMEGKVLQQSDMTQVQGMSRELTEFHEETGEYSQWTNSMFSGMPAFHVGTTGAKRTIYSYLAQIMRFGSTFISPFGIFMLLLLGFYILLLSMRLNHWLSAIGSGYCRDPPYLQGQIPARRTGFYTRIGS